MKQRALEWSKASWARRLTPRHKWCFIPKNKAGLIVRDDLLNRHIADIGQR